MQQDKRKRVEAESDSEEMEEEPIELDKKAPDNDQVELEFLFYDPSPDQFHSVKTLNNGYLDGISFKSSELTDMITQQPQIGTMIGVEDSKDVFGFVTVLNIGIHEQKSVIQELINYVTAKSLQYNKHHIQFMHYISNYKKLGLLVNERVLNLAPQLVPLLHQQLNEDIKWTKEEDPSDKTVDVSHLLVVTKAFKDPKTQKSQKKQVNELQQLVFPKFEDYVLLQKADMHFIFESKSNKNTSEINNTMEFEQSGQICYRIIYLISLQSYLASLGEIAAQIQA